MRRYLGISIFMVLLVVTGLSGCATSIGAIRKSPDRYVGSIVTVTGTVEKVIVVPFVHVSIFTLSDTDGSMVAISSTHQAAGSRVTFRARVLGVSEKGSLAASEPTVDAIASFLVEHKIVGESSAHNISKTVLGVIATVAGGVGGSYLLVEQDG